LKGQISIEYTFAFLAWVLVCVGLAYAISPYVSLLTSQYLLFSETAATQSISEVAGSDLDGLKLLKGHYNLEGNFTFNNTVASFKFSGGEAIVKSVVPYSYADTIRKGDKMIIKNQDGEIRVIRVP